MKKRLAFFLFLLFFLACSKGELNEEDSDQENEEEIETSALPQNIQDTIAKQFPGYTMEEAEKITQKDGSKHYCMEIEKIEDEMEVMYSADGKFLGKESENEDTDDKEEDKD